MEEEKEKRKEAHPVSRRSFIKGAGLVAGGVAIGACSSKGEEEAAAPGTEGAPAVKEVVKEVPVATEGMLPPALEPEETFLGPYGTNQSEGVLVDVKNGKIVRMRPFRWDWKYTQEQVAPSLWEFTARGKTYKCRDRTRPGYISLAYKKRIYSPAGFRFR